MILDAWYGIVPNAVLFDPDIKDKELRIFIYISSLCAKRWYARPSNKHLADKFNTSVRTVTRYVNKLKGKWYLVVWIRRYHQENWDIKVIRYIKIGDTYIKPGAEVQGKWHWEEVIEEAVEDIPEEVLDAIIGDQENTEETKKSKTPKLASNYESNAKIGEHNITRDNNNSTRVLSPQKEQEILEFEKRKKTVQTWEVLGHIKQRCTELWFAYSWTGEDFKFAKHIWSSKNFWEFAAGIWKSRIEFAKWVLVASVQMNYFKWPLTSAELIYRNYSEIYNRRKIQEMKKSWMIEEPKKRHQKIDNLPSL